MTKDDFAARLAARTDLSKAKAREVIDCIFGTDSGTGIIAVELDAGRDFMITGFGTFATRHRKARTGRNPQTGDQLLIPERTVPTFKAGKNLKERVGDRVPAPAPVTPAPTPISSWP
jgi:DNA-binding protein HU-beta